MSIDERAPRPLLVTKARQAEVAIALAPDADLVVVQVDKLPDLPVGAPFCCQQQDASTLGSSGLEGPSTSPSLENLPVALSQFQRR